MPHETMPWFLELFQIYIQCREEYRKSENRAFVLICVCVCVCVQWFGFLPYLIAATAFQVLRSSARIKFVVKGAVSTVTRCWAASVLAVFVVTTLSGWQDLAVASTGSGHRITLRMGIVDHRGELSATCVDEPVGNLVCEKKKKKISLLPYQ